MHQSAGAYVADLAIESDAAPFPATCWLKDSSQRDSGFSSPRWQTPPRNHRQGNPH